MRPLFPLRESPGPIVAAVAAVGATVVFCVAAAADRCAELPVQTPFSATVAQMFHGDFMRKSFYFSNPPKYLTTDPPGE